MPVRWTVFLALVALACGGSTAESATVEGPGGEVDLDQTESLAEDEGPDPESEAPIEASTPPLELAELPQPSPPPSDDRPIDEGRWDALGQTPRFGRAPRRADLTGLWIEAAGQTPAGPQNQPPPCPGHPRGAHWRFAQRGDEVQAEYLGATSHGSPIPGRSHVSEFAFLMGSREAGAISLEGRRRAGFTNYGPRHNSPLVRTTVPEPQPIVMSLRWDRASRHLVGTKDGQPVRLVPVRLIQRTEQCRRVRPRS